MPHTSKREESPRTLEVLAWNGLLPKLEEKKTADSFVADEKRHRYVMTDGAAQASYARDWSQMLAEYALKHLPGEGMDREKWLESSRVGWQPLVDERQASAGKKFFQQRKGARTDGAATLLVLWFDTDTTGKPRWCAASVGDTCLFWIRQGQFKRSFPCTRSDEFTTHPDLLFSVKDRNDGHFKWDHETLEAGDVFLLATDGLAQWLLKKHEQNEPRWNDMVCFVDSGDEDAFRKRMDEERSAGHMEDDDISLAIIRVRQCPAESSVPVDEIREIESPAVITPLHEDEPMTMVDRINRGNSERGLQPEREWQPPPNSVATTKPHNTGRSTPRTALANSLDGRPENRSPIARSSSPLQVPGSALPHSPKVQSFEAPAPEPYRIREYLIWPWHVRELLVPAMVAVIVSIVVSWWKTDDSNPAALPATQAPATSIPAAQLSRPEAPAVTTETSSPPVPQASSRASSSASSQKKHNSLHTPPGKAASKAAAASSANNTRVHASATASNATTTHPAVPTPNASSGTLTSSGAPSTQPSAQSSASPATTASGASQDQAKPQPSQAPSVKPSSPTNGLNKQSTTSRNGAETIKDNLVVQNAHPMIHVNQNASLVLP